MADLFEQIKQLYRKEPIEDAVNTTVLHRFLVSEQTLAPAVKQISHIRDDRMVVAIWMAALPKAANPPRFKYAAVKKPKAAGELAKKIAEIEGYTLLEAEEAVALLESMGVDDKLMQYYGIEVEDDDEPF